jgi:hypothetical protein
MDRKALEASQAFKGGQSRLGHGSSEVLTVEWRTQHLTPSRKRIMGVIKGGTQRNQGDVGPVLTHPRQQRSVSVEIKNTSRHHGRQTWSALDDHPRIAGPVDLDGNGTDALERDGERFGYTDIVVDNEDQGGCVCVSQSPVYARVVQ